MSDEKRRPNRATRRAQRKFFQRLFEGSAREVAERERVMYNRANRQRKRRIANDTRNKNRRLGRR